MGTIVRQTNNELPVKVILPKAVKNLNGAFYFKEKKKLSKRGQIVLFENVD